MNKKQLATLGLIFITFLSAIQYVFLQNVPDTVSTFSFLCISNVLGLVILSASRYKKLLTLEKKTLKKGALFALELTGFNFFLLLGSRHLDSVIISSVVSMYFVFVTPILLLLKKKVNFFSGIATVIAIVALLLMFGADTDALFSSVDVVYLLLADIFFASYVVSISILGEDEDSSQLTMAQMICAICLAFAGWIVESLLGHGSLSLPRDPKFWISACFIGFFIRAIYGLIQISAQKHVSALTASLVFASEIIITLALNPILSRLFGSEYTPATLFQIIGCVLFIIATLLVDETTMSRLGYKDMETSEVLDADGNVIQKSSVAKKMIFSTLTFTMITLIACMIVCLSAISFIRSSAVESSTILGESASRSSAKALTSQLEVQMQQLAEDKAKLAEAKLGSYSNATAYAASFATSLFRDMNQYPAREVDIPRHSNAGIWAMQRTLENETIPYEDLIAESMLLGNMEDVFAPIIRDNQNIATIYMGTENGLLISYDPNSGDGNENGESYYEYKDSSWYNLGKNAAEYAFTDTYQDGYGRGLTITCVAPFYGPDGKFMGCVAMDILMKDLNENMVSDGIIDPSVATLIDNDGNIIASKDIPEDSEQTFNIFDPAVGSYLLEVGHDILDKKDGITSTGEGDDAIYIAYSTIDSTQWTLCIISPVSTVIEPANMIRAGINENTQNVVVSVVQGILTVVQSCLVLSAVILLTVTFTVGKYSRKISDPLKKLEADVQEISEGNFDQRTDVTTDDEIGSLARSFNFMTESLQHYIVDLKEVTAKEERIASELSVATQIQAHMLPTEFPREKDYTIYATMDPAKEVGGDFYDFFMVDKDHLAMVMADVSGKGVPAALFMAVAKALIKIRTMMGGSPSQILYDVNNQLCEGNDAGLFVTVWMGILDLNTGKGIAANAGHEHPTIRRKDGKYELVVYRHSPSVACMEGIRFREHEFQMYPGDSLYVYTDGVPEATDAHNELFGTDRMLEALNADPNAAPEQLLKNVRAAIDRFVGEAEQFDDITMLSMDYYGRESQV